MLQWLNYFHIHEVEQPAGLQCSMFAVWGSRTANGQLFSGRNLDWNKGTGKQITLLCFMSINNKSLMNQ